MTETDLNTRLRLDVLAGLELARKGLAEAGEAVGETGALLEDPELMRLKCKIELMHEDVTRLIEAQKSFVEEPGLLDVGGLQARDIWHRMDEFSPCSKGDILAALKNEFGLNDEEAFSYYESYHGYAFGGGSDGL